jgi:hypothetical protein
MILRKGGWRAPSFSLVHFRYHFERLLPPLLDKPLDRCVAHFAVQAQEEK